MIRLRRERCANDQEIAKLASDRAGDIKEVVVNVTSARGRQDQYQIYIGTAPQGETDKDFLRKIAPTLGRLLADSEYDLALDVEASIVHSQEARKLAAQGEPRLSHVSVRGLFAVVGPPVQPEDRTYGNGWLPPITE